MAEKEEIIAKVDEVGNKVDAAVRKEVNKVVDEKIAPVLEKATSSKNWGLYLIGGIIVAVVIIVGVFF